MVVDAISRARLSEREPSSSAIVGESQFRRTNRSAFISDGQRALMSIGDVILQRRTVLYDKAAHFIECQTDKGKIFVTAKDGFNGLCVYTNSVGDLVSVEFLH